MLPAIEKDGKTTVGLFTFSHFLCYNEYKKNNRPLQGVDLRKRMNIEIHPHALRKSLQGWFFYAQTNLKVNTPCSDTVVH